MQTTCPICHTVFRVEETTLSGSKGMVQCGVCGMVFDAHHNGEGMQHTPAAVKEQELIEIPVESDSEVTNAETDAEHSLPETAAILPEATLYFAQSEIDDDPALATNHLENNHAALIADELPSHIRFTHKSAGRHATLLLIIAFLLVFTILVQFVRFYRNTIAVEYPWSATTLTTLCNLSACVVALPEDLSAIKITHTSFETDPNHPNHILVNIGVENDADITLAYPHLSLSLTDANDLTVTRRNFAADVYIDKSIDASLGLAPHSEVNAKLIIDADDTSITGYKVAAYY